VTEQPRWVTPVVTRSKLVLEVASELVGRSEWGPQQARLTMRYQGAHNPWEVSLLEAMRQAWGAAPSRRHRTVESDNGLRNRRFGIAP
jgi:hypothetical protein